MGKRGSKPEGKVNIKWSPNFAYAIGLLASDGCLSKDGRHVILTSKDIEQLTNFKFCLGLVNKIGRTMSGYNGKAYTRIQFGDILFYKFLVGIGLTPAKSKTIGKLKIPKIYFFDFLRGVLDGDGYTYSYFDKRWKSSFMFYLGFVSASHTFVIWIQDQLRVHLGVHGHITKDGKGSTYQLKYAKKEGLAVLRRMYSSEKVVCLSRKHLKIRKMLAIVGESLG